MSPTCSFTGNPVLKSLQNFCGNDVAKYLKYFSRAFTSDPKEEQLEAKADFIGWYKKNYKKDLDLNTILMVQYQVLIKRIILNSQEKLKQELFQKDVKCL